MQLSAHTHECCISEHRPSGCVKGFPLEAMNASIKTESYVAGFFEC